MFIAELGKRTISLCDKIGDFGVFCIQVFRTFFRKGCNPLALLTQMSLIGVGSLSVVILTGSAIGAILALHGYSALHQYGADRFLGSLEYLSMTREFGSVITALMVIARSGSSMTAEIGSMSISEQIYALITLSIDPMRYVVVPRVIGAAIVLPLLSLFCIFFGVSAGYIISIYLFHVNAELYVESIRVILVAADIYKGMIKAFIFGLLLSLICTYKGMRTRGGAKDIGISTTESVVYSSVTVFLSDYVLSSLLFDYS